MAKAPKMQIDTTEPASTQNERVQNPQQSKTSTGSQTGTSGGNFYESVTGFVKGHNFAVLGGLAGLLIATLFFTLGLWKTMIITLLVFVGVMVGQYLDGDPKIYNMIRSLLAQQDQGDK